VGVRIRGGARGISAGDLVGDGGLGVRGGGGGGGGGGATEGGGFVGAVVGVW